MALPYDLTFLLTKFVELVNCRGFPGCSKMTMTMKTRIILALPAVLAAGCAGENGQEQRPNVVLIIADDLGPGDVSCYGSRTICTPNIDSLASSGIRFDNAHASSATSTPSRYALLTGMYPWKNPDAKILQGDAPLLIPTDIPTMPKLFQDNGYYTAAIGKWHLGMGAGNPDWNEPIVPSANTVGFDYTCLIAATNDRVPTVYVEDGLVEGLEADDPIFVNYEKNFEGEPDAISNPELVKMRWHHGHNNSVINGIPRIGFMKGGTKARWSDEDMADYFLAKFRAFLDGRDKKQPFFLYYGLHQPHVPRVPNPRFAGSSGLGPRGDVIVEADWCVGEIVAELRDRGLLDNTLIIFTSDNGPVLNDGYYDDAVEMLGNHDPMDGRRGGKYSLFDAGTRVPLIFTWGKNTVPEQPAGTSDALVSQLDLFASMASLLGADMPTGTDSQNTLETFEGVDAEGRESMVIEAQGRTALISGDYVIIPPYKGRERNITGNELGNLSDWALFNLAEDPGQRVDLAASQPELLDSLRTVYYSLTK